MISRPPQFDCGPPQVGSPVPFPAPDMPRARRGTAVGRSAGGVWASARPVVAWWPRRPSARLAGPGTRPAPDRTRTRTPHPAPARPAPSAVRPAPDRPRDGEGDGEHHHHHGADHVPELIGGHGGQGSDKSGQVDRGQGRYGRHGNLRRCTAGVTPAGETEKPTCVPSRSAAPRQATTGKCAPARSLPPVPPSRRACPCRTARPPRIVPHTGGICLSGHLGPAYLRAV